jgi:predicted RNA-binding protein associated with RNAse of E/G family
MLERKFGNHANWKRILKRHYAQTFVDSESFKGYLTLLKMDQVAQPLYKKYGIHEICIADNGYSWMHQYPLDGNYTVTTMFDEKGAIVQWYIDLCENIGLENGVPRMDDLFLDLVVLPSGELFQLDLDELNEALVQGIIDRIQYQKVLDEADRLTKLIKSKSFLLLKQAHTHKRLLEKRFTP